MMPTVGADVAFGLGRCLEHYSMNTIRHELALCIAHTKLCTYLICAFPWVWLVLDMLAYCCLKTIVAHILKTIVGSASSGGAAVMNPMHLENSCIGG